MRLTYFLPLVLVSTLGCTTQGGTEAADSLPTSSVSSDLTGTCNTDTIYPTEWRPGMGFPFPDTVQHLENIEIRWDTESFYAWGIGDGNVVTYAYHVQFSEQTTFNKAMIDAMPSARPTSTTSQSWGVQGVGGPCCAPHGPPIGPGPIGFPPVYVKRLGQFAGTFTDGANYGNQTMGQFSRFATAR